MSFRDKRREQKKCIYSLFWGLLLTMMLSGCTRGESEVQKPAYAGNDKTVVLHEFSFLDTAAGAWKDNSLDTYRAKFQCSLAFPVPEGYIKMTSGVLHAETRAYASLYYWEQTSKMGKSEYGIIEDDGMYRESDLSLRGNMNNVLGTDHLTFSYTEEQSDGRYAYHFWETDENGTVLWEFYADFLDHARKMNADAPFTDKDGNLHFLASYFAERKYTYYVVNTKGEILASFPLEDRVDRKEAVYSLIMGADGNVYVKRHVNGGKELDDEDLYGIDLETGKEEVITSRRKFMSDRKNYFPLDDKKLLYVSPAGVFRCNYDWTDSEPLYLWSNHGISADYGYAYVRRNGEIAVSYHDGTAMNYMVLAPTTEQVEIHEVILAVTPFRRAYYERAAALFNRKYPAYHVEIKSDYDQTRLLAELTTGNGPVLVDTSATGFRAQEKLWEPLDGLLESAGMREELLEKPLEFGKIDGITYGFVSDFSVKTLVVLGTESNQSEWTYDEFLKRAADPKIKAVFQPTKGNIGGKTLATTYFMHGLQENYLLDSTSLKNCLNKKNLEQVLNLAAEKCHDEGYGEDWYEAFRNGEVLCAQVHASNLSTFSVQRERYGDDISYVGYPTKDGGRHFMEAYHPICVCTTAPEEDKIVAYTFLRELLTHEGQIATSERNVNFGISVRKDMFEEQVQSYIDKQTELIAWMGKEGLEKTKKQLEEDRILFRKLVEEAIVEYEMPPELDIVLDEEFTEYFQGNITRDALEDHVENRVRLYLSETE